jgi:glycerol-3-phosphate acyltransferase PlsX
VYSAGNSGAVMASAIFRLGRLKGIDRPAVGALFPTKDPNQQVLVLDVGANMDAKAAYLHQFALLGNIYSRDVLQVPRPRIGLLNIGEEECKGNELCLKTYPLLAADDRFVFAGNCEGRDVLSGDFDVVVCDGFTGNVLLKFLESVGSVLLDVLRAELPGVAAARWAPPSCAATWCASKNGSTMPNMAVPCCWASTGFA